MAADALALDTNVLVRLLTNDEPRQALRAQQALDQAQSAGSQCWVGQVVLCELVWVLNRAYGYGLTQCQQALTAVLAFPGLRVEGLAVVLAAVKTWGEHGGDFADHLIGHQMGGLGCRAVLTFDRKAAKLPTHQAL